MRLKERHRAVFFCKNGKVRTCRNVLAKPRVWKGVFGIRDLTKIQCGNREHDKYIDGIQDLTVSQEAGLAQKWARDTGFILACLS